MFETNLRIFYGGCSILFMMSVICSVSGKAFRFTKLNETIWQNKKK